MNYRPNRKIATAGGIGVPLAIIIAWGLTLVDVQMPAEVSTALGGIISTLIAYIVPESKNEP